MEAAEEPVRLVLVAHRALLDLQDLREIRVNEDQKAPVVFRVPLGPLEGVLVVLRSLDPKAPVVLLAPQGPRVMLVRKALPDRRETSAFKVHPDLMVNRGLPDLLDLLALRVLLDPLALLESVVLPDRMPSLRSLITTSPRRRPPRRTAIRPMSRMLSDRLTPSRTALGTTPQ